MFWTLVCVLRRPFLLVVFFISIIYRAESRAGTNHRHHYRVSSICPGRLSTAWSSLSFLVIWSTTSGDTRLWGGWCALPRTISFFSHRWLYLGLLSSPWPRCWCFYHCMWCWADVFPFWSVRPQVCSVIVWSVSKAPGGSAHGRGISDSPSTQAKLAHSLTMCGPHTSF